MSFVQLCFMQLTNDLLPDKLCLSALNLGSRSLQLSCVNA